MAESLLTSALLSSAQFGPAQLSANTVTSRRDPKNDCVILQIQMIIGLSLPDRPSMLM